MEVPLDTGDTAWVLISTALVLFMTPGLAFFYGGMVRAKNMLGMLMQNFFAMGLIGVLWAVVGFSLAFGDGGGYVGNFDFAFMTDVNVTDADGVLQNLLPGLDFLTIPPIVFFAFQMMFAIITPALISGAFAERKRFKAFALFSALWLLIVYAPVAHWVWGVGGWIRNLGALDFAGGTVVHITSGISALVCALVLGKRSGYGKESMEPHNATITVLGTGILWFGWFGFNAGSALGANTLAVTAFVNTHLAAAMAAMAWMTASWIRHKRPSVLGAAAGAVAGLVGITPAAGFVTPMAAIIIGFLAGVGCFTAVELVVRGRVDDALDVFGVHGVGGIIGALATGLFATTSINPAGFDGLFYGNPGQLLTQLIAVVVTGVYAAVMTYLLLKLINLAVGIRVSPEEEARGLDSSLHGETAYQI
jgi:Amt family ammonium transporter